MILKQVTIKIKIITKLSKYFSYHFRLFYQELNTEG